MIYSGNPKSILADSPIHVESEIIALMGLPYFWCPLGLERKRVPLPLAGKKSSPQQTAQFSFPAHSIGILLGDPKFTLAYSPVPV